MSHASNATSARSYITWALFRQIMRQKAESNTATTEELTLLRCQSAKTRGTSVKQAASSSFVRQNARALRNMLHPAARSSSGTSNCRKQMSCRRTLNWKLACLVRAHSRRYLRNAQEATQDADNLYRTSILLLLQGHDKQLVCSLRYCSVKVS